MPTPFSWLSRAFGAGARAVPKLAFAWQLSGVSGWGQVGVHTALYLLERGQAPLLLDDALWDTLPPPQREPLSALQAASSQIQQLSERAQGQTLVLEDFHVLHAAGNGFVAANRFRGFANTALMAFEDTRFDRTALERSRHYDRVIVHSTYNRKLLEAHGLDDVGLVFQGIDETEMRPLPRQGRFAGRFVVFSGGKLEFRKAQDLVLAAFVRFHARHREALLVVSWDNFWPRSASSMAESRWAPVAPQIDRHGRLRVREWALANGVAPDAFVDLGLLQREQIAAVLAECDAAVFPNRCEGATNLVAKEAMACGVPVVLSANTGHLDIAHPERCCVLREQAAVPDAAGRRIGWGESSVEELVEHLEAIYSDRAAASARAQKALEFVRRERTWRRFAEALVAAL